MIELLVVIVIVIISILAAMLLPALSTAKATAKKSLCASNLKQSTMETMCYANDFNSLIYLYWHPNGGEESLGRPLQFALSETGYKPEYANLKTPPAHRQCPSVPVPANCKSNTWGYINEWDINYDTKGLNFFGWNILYHSPGSSYGNYLNLARMRNVSKYPYLFDSINKAGRMFAYQQRDVLARGAIGLMHLKKSNVAFCGRTCGFARDRGMGGSLPNGRIVSKIQASVFRTGKLQNVL